MYFAVLVDALDELDSSIARTGTRTTWNVYRPTGSMVGKYTSEREAFEAVSADAIKGQRKGIYKVLPPTRYEVNVMGFRARSQPPPNDAGQVWIEQDSFTAYETTSLVVSARRGGGSNGAIAVDWTLTGGVEGSPTPNSGTLTWAAGELGSKSLSIAFGLVTGDQAYQIVLQNPRATTPGARAPTLGKSVAPVTVLNDVVGPDAPAQPTVVATTTSSVTLNAAAPAAGGAAVTNALWYRDGVLITSGTGVAWGNFTDSGRAAGTTYSYRVAALDAAANVSAQSPARTATTQSVAVNPPGVPNALVATAVSPTQVDLSCSPPASNGGSAITGYDFEWAPASTGPWTAFPRQSNPAYSDTGIAAATTRHYRVRCVNSVGASAYTSTVSATTPAASGVNEAADWAKRSGMPSVVWAHNFEQASEVGAFRVVGGVGNDVNNTSNSTLLHDPADGFAGGGSMIARIPTGGAGRGGWNRPMAALVGSQNGKGVDDPGANGTVTRRSGYNAASNTMDWDWRNGYYAHLAIQQALGNAWAGNADAFDGREFWCQFRCKITGTRWSPGNPSGKLVFIDVTGLTGSQEIVIQSENRIGAGGDTYFQRNPFRMYTNFGSAPNALLTEPQGTGARVQPGGPFKDTCIIGQFNAVNRCWEWPADEWVVVLMHVIPGRDNESFYGANPSAPLSAWPFKDMTIEAWVQRPAIGETTYTKVYENFGLAWDYYSSGRHPAAFNKIGPSSYMNDNTGVGVNAPVGWDQKFTQILFSKDYIPPVGEKAGAWWTAAPNGQWTAIAGGVGQRIQDVLPNPVPVSGLSGENPTSITKAWTGGGVDQRRGEYMLIGNGGHADYPGNEGYALSLRADSPAWRRLSDPTPNNQLGNVTGEGGGIYADGRPRAMHSTFEVFGDGEMWFALQNSVTSGGGGSVMKTVRYNRDMLGAAATPAPYGTNPWTVGNALPLAQLATDGTALIFGVSAFDRVGHKVWGLGGNSANITSYWSIDTLGPTKGAVVGYAANKSFGHFGGWVAIAHDLRILIAGDHLRSAICVLDLDNPNPATNANAWTQIANVTGTPFFAAGSGGVYVQKNRCLAIGDPRSIGNTIYKLVIPTKVQNGRVVYDPAGQWVWTNFTPAGPAISGIGSGAYSKWNIVEDMGDGRSAIVYVPEISGPTYVYKIPQGGL